MQFINNTIAIIKKDLILELRGKEAMSIMVFLSILLLVIFNIALDIDKEDIVQLAAGVLWVIFAFSGIVGMEKTSASERHDSAYLNLIFSSVNIESFYTAKVISNFIFLLFMELFTIVFFAILFNFEPLIKTLPLLFIPLVLGSLGLSIVGTLLSFISTGSRFGELLLPFLFLPVVVPVLLGGVNTTESILSLQTNDFPYKWVKLLVLFDVLYYCISVMVFKYVMEE